MSFLHSSTSRWRPWSGVLALVLLLSHLGCASHARHVTPPESSEPAAIQSLSTRFEAVRLGASEFDAAVATLVLHSPLRVHAALSPPTLRPRLLRASHSAPDGVERTELLRSYARFCERRGSVGDCLRLLEDGPNLDGGDRRDLALALAVSTALESLDSEVRALFSTSQLWTTLSITLTGYMVLLAAPEPFSKGVATALTVLLWAYLGWELLDLLQAWFLLSEEAHAATTFAQLRTAGERFGRVIGPNSVRILVMLGTAAIGGSGPLLSRAPSLPGFARAANAAKTQGVRLLEAARDADRVRVAVAEGTLQVVLPANALSMAARGGPQVHHIATVENNTSTTRGGPWTPRFKKFFDKAGMSMEDPANKLLLDGHKGPHPEAYHREVYRRLKEVSDQCMTPQQCRSTLTHALRKMMHELSDPSSTLRQLLVASP